MSSRSPKSFLPPELENIVGMLSEGKEYKSLMYINPKIHTKEKFIKKELSEIDLKDLVKFNNAYKLLSEYCESKKIDFKLEKIGIFIKLLDQTPDLTIFGIDSMYAFDKNTLDYEFNLEILKDLSMEHYNNDFTNLMYEQFTEQQKVKMYNWYSRNNIKNFNDITEDLEDDFLTDLNYDLNIFRSQIYEDAPEISIDDIANNIKVYIDLFIKYLFFVDNIAEMLPKDIQKQLNEIDSDTISIIIEAIEKLQKEHPKIRKYGDINVISKILYPYITEEIKEFKKKQEEERKEIEIDEEEYEDYY